MKDSIWFRPLCVISAALWSIAIADVTFSQETTAVLHHVIIESPSPQVSGEFGSEVIQDATTGQIYIGAPGERRVYELVNGVPQVILEFPTLNDFGRSLAAYDGVLLAAAPQSNTVMKFSGGIVEMLDTPPGSIAFGRETVIGDPDGDGILDAFIADPVAGKVYYFGSGTQVKGTLINPGTPVATGSFGHSMGFVQWTGGGSLELAISSPGNDSGGVTFGGQIFVFENVAGANPSLLDTLDPPAPVQGDNARFGMNIATRGNRIGVGEPRLNTSAEDSGSIYLYRPSGLVYQQVHTDPNGYDLLGYRVLLGDFGLVGFSLAAGSNEGLVFKHRFTHAIRNSGHHWAQSVATVNYGGTPKDDIMTGDNTYQQFRGRVVFYLR